MNRRSGFDSPWPPVVGGLVALAVALLIRSLAGVRLLAEIIVDASTDSLQPKGFSFFLDKLGGSAKPLLFFSVLLEEMAFYLVVWRLVTSRRAGEERTRAMLLAGGLATAGLIVSSAALVVLTHASLGSQTSWLGYSLSTLLSCGAFAVVAGFIAAGQDVAATETDSRRAFLLRLPVFLLGATASVIVAKVLLNATGGGVQSSTPGLPTEEVTSNDKFYIVSKNLIDPQVDASRWRLRVGGNSQGMLELTYNDVLAWPSHDQYATLQCISNEVGGDLMSNALWTGFPLRELIARVQPSPSAAYVMFRCDDDYTESLPLDFAMHEGVMLVHHMNGEPLPNKHGFPLRLLSPGKYGMKNPKWITEIALIDKESFGYWEQRNWDPGAPMNTTSRIDVPRGYENIVDTSYRIHGVAFSGDRGVSRVEVSTDNKATWHDAVLKPALGPYTWVLWYYDWTNIQGDGRVEMFARATDGTGEVQTVNPNPPYPSGATGYPRIPVYLKLPT